MQLRVHGLAVFMLAVMLIITSSASAASKRSCLRELKKCGHDTKDDTELLNQLFAFTGKIKILAGTYYVDATTGIRIGSNTRVLCKEGVEFRCIPNNKKSYNIFLVQESQNVEFNGGKIIGDRNEHTGTGGEHGMGISVMDSQDVSIIGTSIQDTWGDAIYIGSCIGNKGGRSENIVIQDCKLSNCRRQGVSVVACNEISIKDCEIYDIGGTAPEAGIDFEVNYKQYPSSNLLVENCKIYSCKGPSIVVGNPIKDLTISNSTLDDIVSSQYSKKLVIQNCSMRSLTVGGSDASVYNCSIQSLGLMNYGTFTFDKCRFNRLTSSKNTGVNESDFGVTATFTECTFTTLTENISQEGKYAHETLAYFLVLPKSLKFEHCSFELKDAWGLQLSADQGLSFTNCSFRYNPSKSASWGSGYGFLHLKSNKGSIIFEGNDVDANQLTQYTAYGLIRTYAPEVHFNRNNIKTSVKNIGTHVVRANNAINEVIEMNDNTIQGYTKEGVFRDGTKAKLLNNKINK